MAVDLHIISLLALDPTQRTLRLVRVMEIFRVLWYFTSNGWTQ